MIFGVTFLLGYYFIWRATMISNNVYSNGLRVQAKEIKIHLHMM